MKNFKKKYWILCVLLLSISLQAQETDSIFPVQNLDEIIVLAKPVLDYNKQAKPLSTVEEYLEKIPNINLIKRGNYAWEPSLNSMNTERIAVTIDGMQIFSACTDKMDPVTSYVEVSNLSAINVHFGQSGATNRPAIGGSVDLVSNKHDYSLSGFSGSANFGVESNSSMATLGSKIKFATDHFFTEAGFMFRNADNYKAGKNTAIEYSQFTKHNAAFSMGGRWKQQHYLSASFIFDNAQNVGYPALPMDVALARAYIASAEYAAKDIFDNVEEWSTKIYYNNITHIMDDTKRPNVAIHMDMPGKSETYGLLSKLLFNPKRHQLTFNLNVFYNRSLAEMTMYPNDAREKEMYMLTWPDVRTLFTGVSVNDMASITRNHSIYYTLHAGFQQNKIASKFGLNSLEIFYPHTQATKNRFLYGGQAGYHFEKSGFELSAGAGYGERAPSVSEAYGFYLFNSFDKYDYIGNPNLKNEKSVEANTSFLYRNNRFKINIAANYFRIFDYIIGKIQPEYAPMTIGASGVRQYRQLKAVNIINTNLSLEYKPIRSLKANSLLEYSFGQDDAANYLPLVKPFSFNFSLAYSIKNFDFEISTKGASKYFAYSKDYGETPKKAYAIVNFSAAYKLLREHHQLFFKLGVENIADTYYSTYADWNNIPRMGRNFFVSISFVFHKATAHDETQYYAK